MLKKGKQVAEADWTVHCQNHCLTRDYNLSLQVKAILYKASNLDGKLQVGKHVILSILTHFYVQECHFEGGFVLVLQFECSPLVCRIIGGFGGHMLLI